MGVSRQCPLACELADLIGEYSTVPMMCKAHRDNTCPIADEMIDAFLTIEDAK